MTAKRNKKLQTLTPWARLIFLSLSREKSRHKRRAPAVFLGEALSPFVIILLCVLIYTAAY
jgi:hypothetical protein